MKRIAWLLLAGLTLAAGLALAAAAGRESEVSSGSGSAPRRVRVAEVETTTTRQQLGFPGVLRSANRARLAFSIGARLAERRVEVGEWVAAGARLARLDDRELELALDRATASVAEIDARRSRLASERARVEKLHAAKAATDEELEQAVAASDALTAARQAAEARVGETRRLLGEAVLVAPFAGTVTAVLAEPGEMVAPGQTLVVISGPGQLEIEIGVPEWVLVALSAGGKTAVRLPLAGLEGEGTIRRIGRAAAPGSPFPVVVALDEDARLLPGMTAEVTVELVRENVLTVPLAAVLDPGGGSPQVFRLTRGGDRVERLSIRVESLVGERVAVTGELAPGDRVVVAGHPSLVDGDAVEVVP